MSVPRVLLLTNVAPGRVGVGRIFLRNLCLLYPHDRICCFHTDRLPDDERAPELDWLPLKFVPTPSEYGFRPFGKIWAQPLNEAIAGRTRPVYERYLEHTKIPHVIEQAVRFGRAQGADIVWGPLHTPNVVRMVRNVADLLQLPLVTTVWDPPDTPHAMHQYGLDSGSLARILADFAETIRSSARCGVASDNMKHRYELDYGTPCVTMIYGPREQVKTDPLNAARRDDRLVIGYAGSLYAREEWEALLSALASRNWRVAGREVVIKVLSPMLQQRATQPLQIEFLGWRDTIEVVQLLSQMDVAYLPYWFASQYQESVQISFPNKLATYVAARVPILYHGPAKSSAMQFFERFPVGVGCHSLDQAEIVQSLERLVMDQESYRRARLACDDAFHQELSGSVFRRRFAELIGVDEDELLPLSEWKSNALRQFEGNSHIPCLQLA